MKQLFKKFIGIFKKTNNSDRALDKLDKAILESEIFETDNVVLVIVKTRHKIYVLESSINNGLDV